MATSDYTGMQHSEIPERLRQEAQRAATWNSAALGAAGANPAYITTTTDNTGPMWVDETSQPQYDTTIPIQQYGNSLGGSLTGDSTALKELIKEAIREVNAEDQSFAAHLRRKYEDK